MFKDEYKGTDFYVMMEKPHDIKNEMRLVNQHDAACSFARCGKIVCNLNCVKRQFYEICYIKLTLVIITNKKRVTLSPKLN